MVQGLGFGFRVEDACLLLSERKVFSKSFCRSHPPPRGGGQVQVDSACSDVCWVQGLRPPWRQPRGKSMVVLVNSHAIGSNAETV